MAVETDQMDFSQVSRTKGVVFKYLSLGASLFGILTLGMLLAYVFLDAFNLANASPEWLLTYFVTLVLPLTGFCLYSVGGRAFAKRIVGALAVGLVVVGVGFTAIETLIRPIPRLTWPLAYLFLVATPVIGYTVFHAIQEPVGNTGFGLLGRLLAGLGVGIAIGMLFHVFDQRLWFLVYTLGVFPSAVLYVAGTRRASSVGRFALPVGIVGTVVAVVLRDILRMYPTDPLVYLWGVVVPIAAVAGGVTYRRTESRRTASVVGAVPLVAGSAGIALGSASLPEATAVIVLAMATAPLALFLQKKIDAGDGLEGLVLPVILVGGSLAGAAIVSTAGFPAPEPWIDFTFLTEAPSRNAAEAGLYPAIVGSVIIIAIVAIISFVLGVATAVFLEEYTSSTGLVGTITRIIQVNIANLAAVPSVVYGLLGLGLFANLSGFGLGTAVTAALTLSFLILPITIVSSQEAIRGVPDSMRRGSEAMGATRWQTTKNVVLPQAFPGILTGIILALGRAIGETAPLLMIGAATTVFNPPGSVWSKFSAMPMQVFAWSGFPQEEFRYGVVAAGVVTLLIVLLGMNATAIVLRNRSESDI